MPLAAVCTYCDDGDAAGSGAARCVCANLCWNPDCPAGRRMAFMTDEQPDLAKIFAEAGAKLQAGLQQAGNILAAQGAMGWAFRGDLTALRATLATMTPEQLRETSAAAALLSSTADELLGGSASHS